MIRTVYTNYINANIYNSLQTLCSVLRALTSNVFPESVAHILTSVFNINNSYNLDLIQYFQEIIDTVDIGVKTMPDEDPDFVPLSNEIHSHYRMINASGLHQLESKFSFFLS